VSRVLPGGGRGGGGGGCEQVDAGIKGDLGVSGDEGEAVSGDGVWLFPSVHGHTVEMASERRKERKECGSSAVDKKVERWQDSPGLLSICPLWR
jgi:hypothetical protein